MSQRKTKLQRNKCRLNDRRNCCLESSACVVKKQPVLDFDEPRQNTTCCSFFSGLPICCQTIEENKFQTDDYNKKNSRHTVNGFFKTVKTNRVFSKSSLVICLISLFLLNLLSFQSVLAAEERNAKLDSAGGASAPKQCIIPPTVDASSRHARHAPLHQQQHLPSAAPLPRRLRFVSSGSGAAVSVPNRAKARAAQIAVVPDCNGGGCDGGFDFNPVLAGGSKSLPGLKLRLNPRGFQYASALFATLLNWVLKGRRLPNLSQCIPELNGCVNVYNLYISRYRCPEKVIVYPSPPNQIVVCAENMDIGVTGNLGGQITVLLPLALFGIVQANLHQLSVCVGVTLLRSPDGYPQIGVTSCSINVGYVDIYIENGGLLGDLASTQFRSLISKTVRQRIISEGCSRLGPIIEQEINPRLRKFIPQSLALTSMLETLIAALDIGALVNGRGTCPASCKHKKLAAAAAPVQKVDKPVTGPKQISTSATPAPQTNNTSGSASIAAFTETPSAPIQRHQPKRENIQESNDRPPASLPFAPSANSKEGLNEKSKDDEQKGPIQRLSKQSGTTGAGGIIEPTAAEQKTEEEQIDEQKEQIPKPPRAIRPPRHAQSEQMLRIGSAERRRFRLPDALANSNNGNATIISRPMSVIFTDPHLVMVQQHRRRFAPPRSVSTAAVGKNSLTAGEKGAPARALAASTVEFVEPGNDPCANCPQSGSQDQLSVLLHILQTLDMNKINNIYLTTQLLGAHATNLDYTIDLNGEFSPFGRGGTPFGPFPMDFATQPGHKMVDLLISDFTINSLFYHLHRSGFLSVRVGPDTPKIGPLLRTTCSDEDDNALEDHGVETDEVVRRAKRAFASLSANEGKNTSSGVLSSIRRQKRQQDSSSGGFGDLGVCLGDIIPALNDQYPNEQVEIVVHTVGQAPSVVISAANGGNARFSVTLDADFYIKSRCQLVGTIRVELCADFQIISQGCHLAAHATVCGLHLSDVGNRLGLTQEALDNLGNLGKEILLKAGNDALEKGFDVKAPHSIPGLPLNLMSPEVRIVEHGLDIGVDFTVTPQGIALLGGADSC